MRTERSKAPKHKRDPSVVGEPLPRLFSPITVEKRFGCAAIFAVPPISPISRRSAQDDLLKWGEVRDFTLTGCRGRQPLPILIVVLKFVCRGSRSLRDAEDVVPYKLY